MTQPDHDIGPSARRTGFPSMRRTMLALACAFLVAGGLATSSSAQDYLYVCPVPGLDISESEGRSCGTPEPAVLMQCEMGPQPGDALPVANVTGTEGEETATGVSSGPTTDGPDGAATLAGNATAIRHEGLAAAPSSHCCNMSIVSQTGGSTRWTDPFGPGATGFNRNPVSHGPGALTGAMRIWKQNPAVGDGVPWNQGTEFVTAWVSCSYQPVKATLQIGSDDAHMFWFNQNTANPNPPGVQCAPWGGAGVCYRSYDLTLLPFPQVNFLRINVKNQEAVNSGNSNPAWVEYRVDF